MKKYIITLLCAVAAVSGNAATLTITTELLGNTVGATNSVVRADGLNGPISVVAGYYTVSPTGTNPLADFAGFVPVITLNSVVTNNGVFEYVDNSFTGTPNGSSAINTPIYLWVFDGANTTIGTASEYGLFTTPGQAWGNTTDGVPSDFYFTPDVTNLGTATVAIYGSVIPTGNNGTFDTAQYALVPEPSTALLGLLAAVGLVIRRRRD